ncbi:hypothetical protein CBM2634_U20014 [Cupriavidus taiwanensis]|uniref:Uncharacterized protein n=1 Tax=Cupriavidus taiwanensis TaxID=164546 RepID=A0A375JCG6_9BURK|nr:hypothetical protein CBM2634_U20014 [Cupriavidus taiwanensis]
MAGVDRPHHRPLLRLHRGHRQWRGCATRRSLPRTRADHQTTGPCEPARTTGDGMTPTDEQERVVEAVCAGGALKVKAYAGAGKTSTLRMAAEAHGRARGLYLAFNKDIATEAASKFPSNTRCRTVHSIAYGATRPEITRKLKNPFEPPHQLALRYSLGPVRLPTTIGKDLELERQQGRPDGDGRRGALLPLRPGRAARLAYPRRAHHPGRGSRAPARIPAPARPSAVAGILRSRDAIGHHPRRVCEALGAKPPDDWCGLHPVRRGAGCRRPDAVGAARPAGASGLCGGPLPTDL